MRGSQAGSMQGSVQQVGSVRAASNQGSRASAAIASGQASAAASRASARAASMTSPAAGSRVGSRVASGAGSRVASGAGSAVQAAAASAAGSRVSATAPSAGASGKQLAQRSSTSQRSGPPPPQVPYMKEPLVAREFERIMANIVRAVLTTRPINIVRFIADYLENELIRRTFFELQSSMCEYAVHVQCTCI